MSVLRNGTPLGERQQALLLELLHNLFQYQLMFRRQFIAGDIQNSLDFRHLDQLEGPTRRAKKCVDVKSAPHTKHIASRISWLHTCDPGVENRKRASQFSLKLTKDEIG
jgi:hypothetical protein